jgi:hypothetical protein
MPDQIVARSDQSTSVTSPPAMCTNPAGVTASAQIV